MSSLDLSTTVRGTEPGRRSRRRSCDEGHAQRWPEPSRHVQTCVRLVGRIGLRGESHCSSLSRFGIPDQPSSQLATPKGLCLRKDGMSLAEVAVNDLRWRRACRACSASRAQPNAVMSVPTSAGDSILSKRAFSIRGSCPRAGSPPRRSRPCLGQGSDDDPAL